MDIRAFETADTDAVNAGARDFYRKPGYDMDEVVTTGKRLEAGEHPRGRLSLINLYENRPCCPLCNGLNYSAN